MPPSQGRLSKKNSEEDWTGDWAVPSVTPSETWKSAAHCRGAQLGVLASLDGYDFGRGANGIETAARRRRLVENGASRRRPRAVLGSMRGRRVACAVGY